MMDERDRLDPVYESERITGSTPPERGSEGNNVVGRPVPDPVAAPFHDAEESPANEREELSDGKALEAGGSFDGLGTPVAEP